MKNKEKAEHHRVMRLSMQQQSYQANTLQNLGTTGMGITHIELIYCRELAHVRNGNCIRYHVHMSLQFIVGIDTMQNSTLTHAIV